jgi:hypothetical protein
MIDREARDRMEAAIRSYMAEETTAFQFDETLFGIGSETQDQTAQHVGRALWFLYDDITDHTIVARKTEWDYLNRLALLLKSDAEVEQGPATRRWSLRNGIAAAALLGFVMTAFRLGWGQHLFAVAASFGIVSMLLAYWERREAKAPSGIEVAVAPFPSISSLLSVRRTIPGFPRRRYPPGLQGRRIRSPWETKVMLIPARLMWLMFAPVILFFQMLPQVEAPTRVRMPEPSPATGSPSVGAPRAASSE